MRPLPSRELLRGRDSGWCLRANHWGEWKGLRRFFALISRLGDGVFWYALMAALVVVDGMDGLAASAHMAATGVIAGFGPHSYELAVRAALDLARRAGATG